MTADLLQRLEYSAIIQIGREETVKASRGKRVNNGQLRALKERREAQYHARSVSVQKDGRPFRTFKLSKSIRIEKTVKGRGLH